jgi:hypothetical protein
VRFTGVEHIVNTFSVSAFLGASCEPPQPAASNASIANKAIIKNPIFFIFTPPNQFSSFPTASIYNIFLL